MAGVSSATLDAWVIPKIGNPYVDHTYVVSSCGLRWRCHGRDQGGAPLGGAPGSSQIADCLSQPNSDAGIRYGFTGLCHQIANRILHPAGQLTVVGSNGFVVSSFAFGDYGIPPWLELVTCYPPGTIHGGGLVAMQNIKDAVRFSGHYRAVSSAHSVADEESIRLTELSASILATLGRPLDKTTFDALAEIQTNLRKSQADLLALHDRGLLAAKEYLTLFNRALGRAMKASEALLGTDRFLAIFGKAGHYPQDLVDEEAFFEDHPSRP